MTSVPNIDMSPKDLVNSDGNYVLQHEDIANLLKYVWSGVLLPVTVPDYQDRLQLSTDTVDKLSEVIESLLAAYDTVSGISPTLYVMSVTRSFRHRRTA